MNIVFLLGNAYGIGGTIRCVFNLAGALAEHNDVEVVSVNKTRSKPLMTLDSRVTLSSLVDLRSGSADTQHRLAERASRVYRDDESFGNTCTRLTDARMKAFLKETSADVVIGTRKGLNVYLAKLGTRKYAKVGQEHLCYERYPFDQIQSLHDAVPKLDAYVTVSQADADTFREHHGAHTPILHIPDCVPGVFTIPPSTDTKVVVAAGRLTRTKRYDLLIQAFAKVRVEYPDWKLRLYGRGPEREKLAALIAELRLDEEVTLMGPHTPMEPEWAQGSIAASAARSEPFGMTLVEAMNCGLPVVAADCPHGPREIITHGRDGLLVRNGDADALADGLKTLMGDRRLRRRMSNRAIMSAQRYRPEVVAPQHEELFRSLSAMRAARGHRRGRRPV